MLAGIAALGLLTLAFIVGAFALLAFGVVALVAAVVLMIRIKWLQHKHRRSEPGIIEGEYTVVREDEPTHRQP